LFSLFDAHGVPLFGPCPLIELLLDFDFSGNPFPLRLIASEQRAFLSCCQSAGMRAVFFRNLPLVLLCSLLLSSQVFLPSPPFGTAFPLLMCLGSSGIAFFSFGPGKKVMLRRLALSWVLFFPIFLLALAFAQSVVLFLPLMASLPFL